MVVARKHHELYEELGSIVGAKYVSDDRGALLSYTRDMTILPPVKPQGVVVRPGSIEEVVEIVRLANQTRTPLIPMGGKASVGGVPPGQPGRGVIVDMRRMDKVLDVDEANMTVTAQCGITLGELASKLNERGLDVHTAFSPHFVDTLGGQIACTSAGFGEHASSVGYNWHYLLGIKVVLPNGSVVDTGTGEGSLSTHHGHTYAKSIHGPDASGLFTGDGGIFGIKVEATLQMFRLPKFEKTGCRCWDTLDEAFQAYSQFCEIDPFLYMQPCSHGMLIGPDIIAFATMGAADVKPAWLVYFRVIANSEEELELKFKTTDDMLARARGSVAHPAVLNFASGFKKLCREYGLFTAMGKFPVFELLVSRRDMLECFKWSREFYEKSVMEKGIDESKIVRMESIVFSGVTAGATSIAAFFDANDRELYRKLQELYIEFEEEATRRGYVVEAPQGHLSKLRAKQWTPEYYNYILTLKKALDPNNIMNPGIFFP